MNSLQTQAVYALDKTSTMPALDKEQPEIALNIYIQDMYKLLQCMLKNKKMKRQFKKCTD